MRKRIIENKKTIDFSGRESIMINSGQKAASKNNGEESFVSY